MKKEEIKHMSQLARMELSSEEEVQFDTDAKKIIGYIDKIKGVTSFVDATADTSVGELRNITREDLISSDFSADRLINLFPKSENNYLIVKKVLE
jgi:aspartyl-tRNA(Asn)/glutamyl-tRNA(Gln) amidotransferase subunit C